MNIFVYGTLMNPDIWFKVTKENNSFKKTVINNYSRSKLKGELYPGIFKKTGSNVIGKIYFDVSSHAISKLDIFEGERYERTKVDTIVENKSVNAQTYVLTSKFHYLLTMEEWNYEEFLNSGNDQFQNSYLGFKMI
jgi:gamma-glutamylcyclotransferase (GGCT)/AIG2-like uncharacterized protein YtfP